jgi:predicted pyridoxine 5'-phosphate oxidase superfamily flavin-nucleotide-binding protein
MGVLTDDMKRVVREQSLGFVATVCADGTPNLSPKGTTTVWDDDHLVFAEIASPQTIENLRSNPAVEVNVVDPIVRKGYRFKGTATIHGKEDPLFAEAIAWYATADAGIVRELEGRARAIVLIRVESAAPLISPAYTWGQTQEEIVAWWEQYWKDLRAGRPIVPQP